MLFLKRVLVFFLGVSCERIKTDWILVLSRIVSSAFANALVSRNGRDMTDTIVPLNFQENK